MKRFDGKLSAGGRPGARASRRPINPALSRMNNERCNLLLSVGKYKVDITCRGVAISGSPWFVSVWDATQVQVYNVPPAGRVGKLSTFNSI